MQKTKSAPPPLLVFSPTSVYPENKIRTTALVGVFTNKRLYNKQNPHHRPCWCFHQQESMQKTKSAPPPLLVFSPTSVYAKNNIRTPPLLVFSPTSVYTENKIRTTALVGVITCIVLKKVYTF
jgi:hypothetical protein